MSSHRTLTVLILLHLALASTADAQVGGATGWSRQPPAPRPSLADRFGAPPSVDWPRNDAPPPVTRTAARPYSPAPAVSPVYSQPPAYDVPPAYDTPPAVDAYPAPRYGNPRIPPSRPSWSPPHARPRTPYLDEGHRRPSPGRDCDDGLACTSGNCETGMFQGCGCEPWTWQFLPRGVIFRSFLAGPKESRLGVSWVYRNDTNEWLMDGTIGGKIGLWRYGTRGSKDVEGFQLDFESAALLRMNWTQELDMDGTDFRFGVPLTYQKGRWEWRFGFYHLSSHTGDEFLVRNNTLVRENYIRDSLLFSLGYFVTPDLRIYGEIDGAFHERAGADAWHFQFGFDYSPVVCGGGGAPFLAVNALLREEVNYGGGLNVHAGWQWRPSEYDHLLRLGVRYYNGESSQYSFFDDSEQLIGFGLWYDY